MNKNHYIIICAHHYLGDRFGKTESLVVNSPQEAIEFFNKFTKDFIVVMELYLKRNDGWPDMFVDRHRISNEADIEEAWKEFIDDYFNN